MNAKLLRIETISRINVIVRRTINRFTPPRTRWQPPRAPFEAFFLISPVRQLEYHNVRL